MIRQASYDDAAALTDAMGEELRKRYQDGAATYASGAQFEPPGGAFFIVSVEGVDVGCGGLRTLAPGIGEIKRMYVDPGSRGQGLSRLVLQTIVDWGRAHGFVDLVLETGPLQPEAIGLYRAFGFAEVPPYGEWAAQPGVSLFFGLSLS